MSALDRQEGGSHYKDFPIQPVEFITRNKLGFLEGCVVKRLCRWQAKDGVKDLRKAIHEIELLIQLTEQQTSGDDDEHPLRPCTCNHAAGLSDCRCPLDSPQEPQNRTPAADRDLPGICVPEGGAWPRDAPNGTRVLGWRPRTTDTCGTDLSGYVEIGFMWDGKLVPTERPDVV